MKFLTYIIISVVGLTIASCSKDNESSSLRDDYLLKTLAPPIAGEPLEFAYAMGAIEGTLKSVTATATIPGAPGTGFDTKSYHVDSRGNDIGVIVADTSTENGISTAVFNTDTVAATLRFSYIVPEEAKGKTISVTFEAESTTGKKVTTSTPQYKVSVMDLKKDINMSNDNVCYFSIEMMQAYTEQEVIDQGLTDKIDLIYIYDPLTPDGYIYGHSLVSPGADERYLNGRTVPASFKKNKTKIEKQVFIRDMQLSGTLPATFVDDIDLETLDLSQAQDYVLGLSNYNSVFVETQDGRYRAYIFFNRARSRKLTFGMKRYTVTK